MIYTCDAQQLASLLQTSEIERVLYCAALDLYYRAFYLFCLSQMGLLLAHFSSSTSLRSISLLEVRAGVAMAINVFQINVCQAAIRLVRSLFMGTTPL